MMTDTEIKVKGLKILREALGAIEAEKFVALIMREPFDYTKWRKQLWPEETVEAISREAMRYRRTSRSRKQKSAAQARSSGVRARPRR